MIVCICNRITESEVRKAVRCGAKTPEEAYACQGCEIQCGCCLDYAQEVIDEELAKPGHLRLVSSRAA
jgi:bacterioferritin-associated ferredoxin